MKRFWDKVRPIRADLRLQKDIALEYGVVRSVISRIKSGDRWGHVTNETEVSHQRV